MCALSRPVFRAAGSSHLRCVCCTEIETTVIHEETPFFCSNFLGVSSPTCPATSFRRDLLNKSNIHARTTARAENDPREMYLRMNVTESVRLPPESYRFRKENGCLRGWWHLFFLSMVSESRAIMCSLLIEPFRIQGILSALKRRVDGCCAEPEAGKKNGFIA